MCGGRRGGGGEAFGGFLGFRDQNSCMPRIGPGTKRLIVRTSTRFFERTPVFLAESSHQRLDLMFGTNEKGS